MSYHSSVSQEMPNYEMIVVSFDDEKRAGEVLDTLKQMQKVVTLPTPRNLGWIFTRSHPG